MAGKKDKAVVAVIKGLTESQASRITGDIIKAKQKYANQSCGTAFVCTEDRIGKMLQRGSNKKIGGT